MKFRAFRGLGACCAALYLLTIATFFVTIRHQEGGHFTYALDDPYIHLALAENLAHGHYGINATEYSSPSSSLLWPFLLIPLVGTGLHVFMPLLWNVLFGGIAAFLLGWAVERWPPQADAHGQMNFLPKLTTAILLMFAANLFSLTIIGMEHVLQVLLSICCVIGLMEALSGRELPRWCLVAAVLAPSVRYEDLSLTVAVAVVLIGQRHWKKAVSLLVLSVIPLVVFSVFLLSKGMPLLPMSVLVKGGVYVGGSPVHRIYILLRYSIFQSLVKPNHFAVVVFFFTFAALAWQAEERIRRYVFGGAAFVAAMQILVGRFGWFNRYEIYAVIFLLMLALRVLAERPPFTFAFYVLALIACAAPYIEGTSQTLRASLDIYRQQYQIHRFVAEYFTGGNYAVNDIGLTSYRRRPGAYVLDLYGLASADALRVRNKSAAWMEHAVRAHDANLAIVYPDWFHIPGTWTPLARMCGPETVVSDEKCVVFFSTTPDANVQTRKELVEFGKTVPKEDTFQLDPTLDPDQGTGRHLEADK